MPLNIDTTSAADASVPSPAATPAALTVGVIGSGVAGLSAAWLLSQQHAPARTSVGSLTSPRPLRVHLYERASRLGMDSEAMDADVTYREAGGATQQRSVHLDMPLRVFTETYYPHLTGLYQTVGVEYQPEDYSGSFSVHVPEGAPAEGSLFFGYRNWIVGMFSVPMLFLPLWQSLFTLSCWRILFDLVRFQFDARRALKRWGAAGGGMAGCDVTLAHYLAERRYSDDFVRRMLVPALAGILTCTHASVLSYPAPIVLSYWCKRTLRGVRRVCQGTQHVVAKLTENVTVQLSTTVERVECVEKDGLQRVRVTTAAGEVREFDHVVIACQANQAVRMLHNADTELTDALKGVRYERSHVITHSDPALMPRDRSLWNSVNFILPSGTRCGPGVCGADITEATTLADPATAAKGIADEGMVTIWLNRAQTTLRMLGEECTPLFQTWNALPGVRPDPSLTLRDAYFERPVVTTASLACIARIAALQGSKHLWFCGSYAEPGMPLLETAVTSAVRVATMLGQPCPWRKLPMGVEEKNTHTNTWSNAHFAIAIIGLAIMSALVGKLL